MEMRSALLVASFVLLSPVHAAAASPPSAPVIIFVHGRGQSDKTSDVVQKKFLHTFMESQKKILGQVVVPESQTRFVWYADVIDTEETDLQLSANCRFAANTSRSAKFKRELRQSLIRAAQALNLDDFGMGVLAGDTHKYLTQPAVRCEADTRVANALVKESERNSPKIVVAHSMGGIVSYSAIERLSTTPGLLYRPTVSTFLTLATQVGLPEVLRGLEGDFVKPPVPLPNLIQRWSNFKNRGDRLAIGTDGNFSSTDKGRLPQDEEIKGNGPAHAIETYLQDKDVIEGIVDAWCAAFLPSPPSACSGTSVEGRSPPNIDGLDLMATNLEFFFDVNEPVVQVVSSEPSHTYSSGKQWVIKLNVNEVNQFKAAAKIENVADPMFFYLAHEFSHAAQQERAVSLLKGEPSLVVECNADLWAGIAFVMAQPMDVTFAYQRAQNVVRVSAESGDVFPIGVHLTDKVASHPEALQRANCAATGINAGLFMYRSRATLATQQLPGDERFEGLLQDPWRWSVRAAREIADYKVPSTFGKVQTWGPTEFSGLAAAAESGAPSLAKSTILRKVASPGISCVYTSDSTSATAKCSDIHGVSERLTLVAYDNAVSMLRPILMSRGWSIESTTRSNQQLTETFAFKKARCIASASLPQLKVAIEFRSIR